MLYLPLPHPTSSTEEKLLEDVESGFFKSAGKRAVATYGRYATATLAKTRNINLRIPERDLLRLKAQAVEKGIPYQTLLASVIHQYSNR